MVFEGRHISCRSVYLGGALIIPIVQSTIENERRISQIICISNVVSVLSKHSISFAYENWHIISEIACNHCSLVSLVSVS
jgi:hypothetical protein